MVVIAKSHDLRNFDKEIIKEDHRKIKIEMMKNILDIF